MADGLAIPSTQVALIESARRALEQARTIEDVKDVRDKAESVRQYMKQVGDSLEAQNIAAELKLRAERKLGVILGGMDLNRGTRVGGRIVQPPDDTPRLEEIGIDKYQSHRYQREASVPDDEFEAFIEQVKSEQKELTTAALLRLAASDKEEPKSRDEWTLSQWGDYVRKAVERILEQWPAGKDVVLADLLETLAEKVRAGVL